MPSLPTSTGLTITNPLVLYRALVATQRIKPDPAQHRLAIHLQKLYHRLKDYQPAIDFSSRLDQISRIVEKGPSSAHEQEANGPDRPGSTLLRGWRSKADDSEVKAVIKRLTDHESAVQLQSPQGLLLYGEVGTGKSLLVDLLADCLPNQKKRRWHFNTFMLEAFAKLESYRKDSLRIQLATPSEPAEHSLLRLAKDLVSTSPIVFLDEFQLPDRAASKILSNLLTSFFQLGGVLIATSNRMPEELANASGVEYASPPASRLGLLGSRWGLLGKRSQQTTSETMFAGKGDFAQFLELLRARCEIWDMEGGKDWRREEMEDALSENTNRSSDSTEGFEGLERMAPGNVGLGYEQSLSTEVSRSSADSNQAPASKAKLPRHYFVASDASSDTTNEVSSEEERKSLEERIVDNIRLHDPYPESVEVSWRSTTLRVYGRNLTVPRQMSGVTKWSFDELCGRNFGPADYITLASTFHTFILTDIPTLTLLQKNEARRLITLLDALYEARCKLLVSAEAGPDDIFFPETHMSPPSGVSSTSPRNPEDSVYPETLSEIYQEQTSPFRPNVSAYAPSASAPSYASSSVPTSASQLSAARSILADEDSDFGPVFGAGRRHGPADGAPGAGNEIGRQNAPDFSQTGAYTGEDEKFAYKRATSRLWEMCGARWWAREGDWWRPLSKEARRWEEPAEAGVPVDTQLGNADQGKSEGRDEGLFRHGASPFRTSKEAPPKFSWTHTWGMMEWGRKAGAWGKGPAGLKERIAAEQTADEESRQSKK